MAHKTVEQIVNESLALYVAQYAIPNDETIQVIRDASEGENMELISFEQFCSDLMAV